MSSRPCYQYEYSRQVEAPRTLNLTAKVKDTKWAKHDANTVNSTCTVKICTIDHGDQCCGCPRVPTCDFEGVSTRIKENYRCYSMPGGVSSEAWDRVSMITPVKKYSRARLSTGLWKTSNGGLPWTGCVCTKVLETSCIFHVQTFKRTFQLSLHLNLGHFEASGINVPT